MNIQNAEATRTVFCEWDKSSRQKRTYYSVHKMNELKFSLSIFLSTALSIFTFGTSVCRAHADIQSNVQHIHIYIIYILKLHHWITTLTSESTNSTKCRIKYSSVNVDHDGTDEWWIFNCFFLFAVCLLRLESVICNANNKWLLKSCSIWVFLAWMVNSVRVVSVAAWSWFFFYLWLHIFRKSI